jgi:acyl-CoA reductase-like NAD-dependent aldehyde dehydrogenase
VKRVTLSWVAERNIVFADADLEKAAAAPGRVRQQGQDCCAQSA